MALHLNDSHVLGLIVLKQQNTLDNLDILCPTTAIKFTLQTKFIRSIF